MEGPGAKGTDDQVQQKGRDNLQAFQPPVTQPPPGYPTINEPMEKMCFPSTRKRGGDDCFDGCLSVFTCSCAESFNCQESCCCM